MNCVIKELGYNIKTLRKVRGLKLVDISNMTGLTPSMISQIENSLISPSISTLKKISTALNMQIYDLFEEKPIDNKKRANNIIVNKSPVVLSNQRKSLSPAPGITYYLLNPDLSGPIEYIYAEYESGAKTEIMQHDGNECGLILEGELSVKVGDTEYLIMTGDSITFSSKIPNLKANNNYTLCKCIWVMTPPWF